MKISKVRGAAAGVVGVVVVVGGPAVKKSKVGAGAGGAKTRDGAVAVGGDVVKPEL